MGGEQRFRKGSAWQFWVAVAVAVLGIPAIIFWHVDTPDLMMLMFPLLFVLPLLLQAGHPDGSMSTLVVDEEGLRIEPLLGGQRFVRRIAWRDMRRIELERFGGLPLLSIASHDHSLRRIRLDTFGKPEAIVAAIRQHIDIDPQALTVQSPMTEDVGNRVLHVIGVAVGALLLTLAADYWLLHAWHTSSESLFAPLLVTLPLAILLAWLWIRGEGKAYPFLAACVSGLLLGGALNFTVLTVNRLYTEARPLRVEQVLLRFDESDDRRQKWTPLDPQALRFRDGYFHIADSWSGFNAALEPGQTYRVTVWRGWLNDIALPPDAFRMAERAEE